MMMKMGRDLKGNKTVKVIVPGGRGFSIQTNGNLPRTHEDNIPYENEISGWVKMYGTKKQKQLFGH